MKILNFGSLNIDYMYRVKNDDGSIYIDGTHKVRQKAYQVAAVDTIRPFPLL